ncbi:hypothetical protein COB55_01765 [Candidatus Wolfebacteria bacterium]|nr:MAG: hypothetical protein COB55_01765 [Candidatus Wolfebacteria bacterium]
MKKFIITLSALALPLVASAQLNNVSLLVAGIDSIFDLLVPIAFTAAVVFFFWGLALYISAQGSEDKQDRGKGIMTWGIVAIFIMSSIWGIVNFIGNALGLSEVPAANVPQIR